MHKSIQNPRCIKQTLHSKAVSLSCALQFVLGIQFGHQSQRLIEAALTHIEFVLFWRLSFGLFIFIILAFLVSSLYTLVVCGSHFFVNILLFPTCSSIKRMRNYRDHCVVLTSPLMSHMFSEQLMMKLLISSTIKNLNSQP